MLSLTPGMIEENKKFEIVDEHIPKLHRTVASADLIYNLGPLQ